MGTQYRQATAQLWNSLITLDIIDEILDIDLQSGTPVRDRKMGWHQYTPSSNPTTPESTKSDAARRQVINVWAPPERKLVTPTLFLRNNPPAQKRLARLENKQGKGKALSILAHKLGRAVYFMLKRKTAFDLDLFLKS